MKKEMGPTLFRTAFIATIWIATQTLAWAATYQLFHSAPGRSTEAPAYTKTVKHLKYGDTVIFSNGRRFRLGKLLGKGNTTMIFAIIGEPDLALRIPKSSGKFILDGKPTANDTRDFIDYFVKGSNQLNGKGVPVVVVSESLASEYAVVTRLDKNMVTYGKFAKNFDQFPEETRNTMIGALDEFIAMTKDFIYVDDLHQENLVYLTKWKKWVVVDLTELVRLFDYQKKPDARSATVLNYLDTTLSDKNIVISQSFKKEVTRWKRLIADERMARAKSEGYAYAAQFIQCLKRNLEAATSAGQPRSPH